MKLKPWHILAGGAAIIAASELYTYRRNAKRLLFSISSITPYSMSESGLLAKFVLKVTNPTGYTYPVPAASVNFSIGGQYVGRATSQMWQTIGPNGEYFIDLVGNIQLDMFGPLVTSIITQNKLPGNIQYKGTINLGRLSLPFQSSYAIGRVFEKKIKKYWKCKDGYYSDHNGPGACNFHGGLIDKEKFIQVCAGSSKSKPGAPAPQTSKLEITDLPLDQINIFREKFQNRLTPYSERSVNNIVNAVADGTFNFAEFDPVLVWKRPDGKIFILSGHSRLEAFTRLCNSGNSQFCTIPAKFSYVSESEAIEIAMRSNTLSTKETDTERALYYMKQIRSGKSYKQVIEAARQAEGSNAARIMAYAYLNPMGKTFAALQALESGGSTSDTIIKSIAQWIGEARLKFPMLTDMHENELYDWLTTGGFGKQYANKNDFLQKLAAIISQRTTFGEFDSSKPLNVFNTVTKSTAEKYLDEQVNEVRQKINELDKSIKTRSIDLKSRGATADQIFNLLQNDYSILSRLRNQLIDLMNKKSQAIEYSKNELALFGKRAAIGSTHKFYNTYLL